MKIHIDNYNIELLEKKICFLDKYREKNNTTSYKKLITETDGTYIIFDDIMYKHNEKDFSEDKLIIVENFYKRHNIITDTNDYDLNEIYSCIPLNHINFPAIKMEYSINNKSNVKLFIEYLNLNNVNNVNSNCVLKHLKPIDFYFEIKNNYCKNFEYDYIQEELKNFMDIII